MSGILSLPHSQTLTSDTVRHIFTVILVALFFTVLAMVSSAQAIEENATVGSVKTISGTAHVNRNDMLYTAHIGDHLYKGDTLLTAEKSSMGVIFRDDTILSLGSRSEVSIDEFIFDPAHEDVSFMTKVSRGTAQFISGQIAKVAPDKMTVETPLSTIGIRGTRFLIKVD
ncbi:FecR domain-containing protein [uncultured Pseudodesulfovibrio sp.]|uniref:FecR family protein n=1 Tax=uncultured Pseudodesulfovibrio sp. TaxID=2035858 RepID=UPI00374798E5